MSDKALSWLFIFLVGLVIAAGVGGYYYGSHRGREKGYAQGFKAGERAGYDAAPKRTLEDLTSQENYTKLFNEYNTLVNDYNTLRSNVIRYVGQTNYQPRQPITCNSSNWGVDDQYTTTRCY